MSWKSEQMHQENWESKKTKLENSLSSTIKLLKEDGELGNALLITKDHIIFLRADPLDFEFGFLHDISQKSCRKKEYKIVPMV